MLRSFQKGVKDEKKILNEQLSWQSCRFSGNNKYISLNHSKTILVVQKKVWLAQFSDKVILVIKGCFSQYLNLSRVVDQVLLPQLLQILDKIFNCNRGV